MRAGISKFALVGLLCLSSFSHASEVCQGDASPDGQEFEYCEAARSAKKSSKAQKTLEAFWWATTTFCGVTCAAEIASWGTVSAVTIWACNISIWGSTAADVARSVKENKAFTQALGQVGLTLGGNLVSNGAMAITQGLVPSSCVGTAIAAARAMYKNNSAKTYKGKREEYLAQARSLQGQQATVDSFEADVPEAAGAQGGVRNGSLGANGSQAPNAPGSDGGCGHTNGAAGFIQCASAIAGARGLTIPKAFKKPSFEKEFKKATGQDLNQFLREASKPGGTQAVLSRLDPSGKAQRKLAKLSKKYAKELRLGGSKLESAYAGGTRAKSQKKASLKGFSFGKKRFGKHARKPAEKSRSYGRGYNEIFSDRSLSLFSRVDERYRKVRKRLRKTKWFSRYNRATAGRQN